MLDPDILSVGMGPVGAWAAILTKKRFPEAKILIFEQYQKPTRDQVLHLDKSCFWGAEAFPELQAFVNDLPSDIQINELQTKLATFAKELGIEVVYQKVTQCKEILQKYPTAKVLIGSDGLHSTVRKEFFDNTPTLLELAEEDELSSWTIDLKKIVSSPLKPEASKEPFKKENLQYFALVTYKIKGDSRRLSWTEYFQALLKGNHMFSEHVGKAENGERTITMRCIIDEETYHVLRGKNDDKATAKNRLSFAELEEVAPLLAVTVNQWKELRKKSIKEAQAEDKPTVSTTILSVCQNNEVYKIDDEERLIVLAGEAYGAVPFYRSINMCLKTVQPLVQMIGLHAFPQQMRIDEKEPKSSLISFSKLSSISSSPLNTLQDCAQTIQNIVSWEAFRAKIKSTALNKAVKTRHLSAASYRQTKLISSEAIEKIEGSTQSSSTMLGMFSRFLETAKYYNPFSSSSKPTVPTPSPADNSNVAERPRSKSSSSL